MLGLDKIFEGGYYNVMLMDNFLSTTDVAPYPNWYKQQIPVKIVKEYPSFYLVDVEKHFNPNHGINDSSPYRVTIDKVFIKNGTFIVS